MGWYRFFRRTEWDRERSRELEAYLDHETDENIARGMSPQEARHAANRKLGNLTRIREEIYHMNTISLVETLWHDLRHAARLLRINPGFALVAILSLALGIGANSAIFQLLDAVRLRNLPVKDPQELVEVRVDSKTGRSGAFTGRYPRMTNALWEQVRDRQQVFSGIFAWGSLPLDLAAGGEARNVQGLWVSGEFFRTLGVTPVLGRLLTSEDDRRGCGSPGAVISYGFWQREFGGSPSAVGRKLVLDGHAFDVIGVTPQQFFGMDVGHSFDVALPICAEPILAGKNSRLDKRWDWFLSVIGRLKPGTSLAQANAQLRAVAPAIFEATVPPELPANEAKNYLAFQLQVTSAGSGLSELRETYQTPLWLLIGIAGVVLLIACANLANLLLARATTREREIAVRLAIGASRGRLVRQLLAESLLLASIGAALGILLAGNLSRALVSFLTTSQDTIFLDLHLDWHVLAFTTGLAVLTSILFGLAPALRATQIAPAAAIKTGGRGTTSNLEGFSLQRALVSSQVALSLVLLFAALLFVRSFRNLVKQDAGFRNEGVLVVNLDLRRAGFSADRLGIVRRELLESLRATAGVDSAAEAEDFPMSGNWSNDNVRTDPSGTDAKGWKISNFSWVSPGYFKTMGMPLRAGRDFEASDAPGSPKVAIVTEAFVRKFFNGADPIGKTFRTEADPNQPEPLYQIVGVVGNAKYETMREDFKAIAFVAAAQTPERFQSPTFVVRSALPPRDVTSSLQRSITAVDPAISINFGVLKTQIEESLVPERLMATLSGFFGALAALLATIGLYGVISYTTTRRRNEIGIRMALGAGRRDVVFMILRQAGVLVAFGLAVGAILAMLAARAATALLFGLRPSDPATLLMAVCALAAVGAVASYLPARRASRLDPMAALRDD
jgi:putative ABC transport system permease protein